MWCILDRDVRVSSELTKNLIECYLPLQRKLKQWSDRKKWVEEPLINSYLFVKISEKDYFKILNISEVVKFVSFAGKAASIKESQIETIKRILDSETQARFIQDGFFKGDMVENNEGSLIGIRGELVNIRGKNQVIVRIEEINHSILLTVPSSSLRKVRMAIAV